MYRIDWEDKITVSQGETVMNIKHRGNNRKIAIAVLVSLQLSFMGLLPMLSNAETENLQVEEDVPEEVLRTEIYTDARSPIDGKRLTAAEYVELMENLRSLDNIPPEDLVSPQVREVINLLKLRKFLRQIIPFIP
nr:hypothetical protein [Pseudanabaena mucicola]